MWTGARQPDHPTPRRAFLLLLAILAPATRAQTSAPATAPDEQPSLEWIVEQSDLIVHANVRPNAPAEFKVEETIKGPPVQILTLAAPPADASKDKDLAQPWADVLLFCDRDPRAARANAASGDVGAWVVHADWAIVLGDRTRPVLRMDGSLVTGGDALLAATRDAAAFAKARGKPCASALIPNADAAALPEGGPSRTPAAVTAPNVRVPDDGRLQSLALRWLEDREWSRRQYGLAAIYPFRTPDNVARVQKVFMTDAAFYVEQAEEWSPRLDERYWREFPVRQAALNRLVAWGERSAADGEIRAPLLRYAPAAWGAWATAAVLLLLAAAACGWRWGFGAFATALSFGAALAVLACWWQASGGGRAYSLAGLGADWEVVSAGGRVAVLRVQDDAPPHGWAVRPYDADEGARLWFAPYLDAREDAAAAAAGCRFAQGVTAGAGGYSFKLVELPYWLPFAAALLWPAAHFVGRARRARRRRRRRQRADQCGVCGADLRGASGRCPQCGAGIVRALLLCLSLCATAAAATPAHAMPPASPALIGLPHRFFWEPKPELRPDASYVPLRWGPIDLATFCVILCASAGRRWRRYEVLQWLAAFAVWSAAALTLTAAHFAWRSFHESDCASFSAGGETFEIASNKGHLAVLTVNDQSTPRAIAVTTFDQPDLWFEPLLTPAREAHHLGFHSAAGTASGKPGPPRWVPPQYPYALLQIPFWAIVDALALLPAAVLARRLTNAMRYRCRRLTGRCAACGYDLRSSAARCPECGVVGLVRVQPRIPDVI